MYFRLPGKTYGQDKLIVIKKRVTQHPAFLSSGQQSNFISMSTPNFWDFSTIRDYTWPDAGYLNYDFAETLDVIKKAEAHHFVLLQEKRIQLEADIAADAYLASDAPEDHKAQYEGQRYDYIRDFNDKLEYTLNSASVIATIAALEGQMYTACRYLKEELRITKEVKRMKPTTGDGELDKLREFLVREVGIDPSGSDPYFPAIKAYKELRNIFAHAPHSYAVTPELTQVLQHISHVHMVKVLGEDRLYFSWTEFLPAMIATVDAYFSNIVNAIDDVFIARNRQSSTVANSLPEA